MVSTTSETTSSSVSRPGSTAGGRSRPNSHHRRRSSVSTRAESADMMGKVLLDLPASSLDDNVNFGDKDSIRRRALLALEGKSEFSPRNATVEIPDLSGLGLPQRTQDIRKLYLLYIMFLSYIFIHRETPIVEFTFIWVVLFGWQA